MPLAYFRAADLLALQAALIDQHSGTHAARVLEDAAGVLVGHRQVRFFYNPLLLHPLGHHDRIFFFELELGREDDQLVQTTLAIGENQIASLAVNDFAAACHEGGARSPLADVAAVAARVAVERAPDGARDANERL